MKTITSSLLKFSLSILIATILFRFLLSYSIDSKLPILVALTAFTYGILMFVLGWYYGKKEWEYLPIYNMGFRFHLTTFIVHNAVSYLWFLFKMNAVYETIKTFYFILVIWAIILLTHFFIYLLMKKNAINNLEKTDLFD